MVPAEMARAGIDSVVAWCASLTKHECTRQAVTSKNHSELQAVPIYTENNKSIFNFL